MNFQAKKLKHYTTSKAGPVVKINVKRAFSKSQYNHKPLENALHSSDDNEDDMSSEKFLLPPDFFCFNEKSHFFIKLYIYSNNLLFDIDMMDFVGFQKHCCLNSVRNMCVVKQKHFTNVTTHWSIHVSLKNVAVEVSLK